MDVTHTSPALAVPPGGPAAAYELKFLLPEAVARDLAERLRGHLDPDPHGPTYRVTTVYYDTPALDAYHRTAGHGRDKYRVRRYGTGPDVFLERKSKRGGRVVKRREPAAAGAWFVRETAERGLRPVCRVTYERAALVGRGPDGPVRVTLDRDARGLPASGSDPDPFAGGAPLAAGFVVGEFKFVGALPGPLRAAVEALGLAPRGVSKYRRCAEAAGLVPGGGGRA